MVAHLFNVCTKQAACLCRASSSTASSSNDSDEATEAAANILALMRRHVESAEVISAAGGECSFRLPREAAAKCARTCAPCCLRCCYCLVPVLRSFKARPYHELLPRTQNTKSGLENSEPCNTSPVHLDSGCRPGRICNMRF